ncbi:MAG: transcriptional repressor [Propionibacteriaceae bacterium]|jgi:Fur family ferric uptake transcriptional regulator|nr:transcriptional repressor [Propionibacteriaceae bacterium]
MTEPHRVERHTRQRQVITAYMKAQAQFLTAQQVHDGLRELGDTVSLPTVYRTLTALVEAGDLDVRVSNNQSAYRHCSPHHHHHLVCRQCGRTIELADSPVEQWATAIANEHGFTDVDHTIEILGLCPACATLAPRC